MTEGYNAMEFIEKYKELKTTHEQAQLTVKFKRLLRSLGYRILLDGKVTL